MSAELAFAQGIWCLRGSVGAQVNPSAAVAQPLQCHSCHESGIQPVRSVRSARDWEEKQHLGLAMAGPLLAGPACES